ncbi:MAG TPA: hypothetical protein VFE47_31985 [Tepidisphaeraceae bacterium]|jgi:hypothetical protein|nr:hypothetical protein [Tepidisphaeraceae bacterium]
MGLTILPSIVKIILAVLTLGGAIEATKTTPIDVMKAYLESYRAGDDTAIATMQINDPAWEITSAGIKNAPARIALWQAIVERFGKDEAQEPLLMEVGGRRFRLPPVPEVAELEHVQPTINGEKAEVQVGPLKYKLKKVEGVWKVDMAQKAPSAKIAREVLDNQRRFHDIAPAFTEDIKAGKFKSANAMRNALAKAFAAAEPKAAN